MVGTRLEFDCYVLIPVGMPPKNRSGRGRGGWQQRDQSRRADAELVHSVLAYELTCQVLLGLLSPQQARLYAELAQTDIRSAQRQGPGFTFSDLDTLAALGCNGAYPNNVHNEFVSGLSTPHVQAHKVQLPMMMNLDSRPARYDQDILLPHETLP